MTSKPEPASALALKEWLRTNGGEFHQDAVYSEDDFGFRVVAAKDIYADSLIVSCPAGLIITPENSRKSVLEILGSKTSPVEKTLHWVERQWIATYLSLHWIVENHQRKVLLNHTLYLNTLPPPEKLRTPLHFSSSELALFRGSNLYGATLDRERDWRKEWENCQNIVAESDDIWGKEYTWEKYLTAATYTSSRAFTSSLLSGAPKLEHDLSAYPILIPGVDSLNHARAHPVSWVVSPGDKDSYNDQGYTVAVVHHITATQGQELRNNYGPKPNAELVLGYGFSLPHNPDDTIVLKLGGFEGQRWEIGRDARNAERLWQEILSNFLGSEAGQPMYEDVLEAALSLQDMTEKLMERLPQRNIPETHAARPEIVEMFHNYIDGQSDILNSLLHFAREREREAVDLARQNGIELILENQ